MLFNLFVKITGKEKQKPNKTKVLNTNKNKA